MARPTGLLALLALATTTLAAGTALGPVSTGPATAVGEPTSSVNVVVFMADDMRHDDLTFMPRVRRLVAGGGTVFENAFSPYPLCCPARASFLTGRAAHNHGVYWHESPYGFGAFDDSFTIGTAMDRAGYQTAFVGKYLNRYGAVRSRVTGRPSHRYVPRGWDQWRGALDRGRDSWWSGSTYHFTNTPYNVNGRVDTSHRGEYNTHTIGEMTRSLVSRFGRSTAPFFVYTSFVAPHFGGPPEPDDPRNVRRRDGTRVEVKTTARPSWVRGRFDSVIPRPIGMPANGGRSEADVSDKPDGKYQLPEMSRSEYRAAREVSRQRAESLYVLDQEVGRTIRLLKRLGEWRSTVFVFTSDNGYYLGEHRVRDGKVSAHEPSLRVPLVVTGPGFRHATRRYDPVTTMDLTATVADVGGASFPWALDGVSVLPTTSGGEQGWHRPVVTEALYGPGRQKVRTWNVRGYPTFRDPRGSIGIRLARFKITVYYNGFIELYDLARDPLEQRGVQDDPSYSAVKSDLLRLWWDRKDCRGPACSAAVPDHLSATLDQTRGWTERMEAARKARYGR